MKLKEILINLKKEIIKLTNSAKNSINDARIDRRTEDFFFLIEDGLKNNKRAENKYSCNEEDDMFYALSYEYVKGNIERTFKAVDLIKENYERLYIDTTYYYLNICRGIFDKGYLIDLCLEKGIIPEIKLISEKETENGKMVCREIMTFTKPFVNKREKN